MINDQQTMTPTTVICVIIKKKKQVNNNYYNILGHLTVFVIKI